MLCPSSDSAASTSSRSRGAAARASPDYVEDQAILARVVALILVDRHELPPPMTPMRVEGGSSAGRRLRERWAVAGLWVHSEVVYPPSRWVKGQAELLQRPISNRTRELQDPRRAAWAATAEPKEHK